MDNSLFGKAIAQPLFEPTFINIDFVFSRVLVFWHWIKTFDPTGPVYTISYIITLFGITVLIYAVVRLVELSNEEFSHLEHAIHDAMAHQYEEVAGKPPRWVHVETLMAKDDENSWRLAIIEADSMLEDALDMRGIVGNGIGEKLKNSTPGDLPSLQAAWDAHLVRNKIAHEGTEYQLTSREAHRTIQLFEMVLKDLGYM